MSREMGDFLGESCSGLFFFDKKKQECGQTGQAEGGIKRDDGAPVFPDPSGCNRSRKSAESYNHLESAEAAGPVGQGTELGDKGPLNRLKSGLVAAVQNKRENNKDAAVKSGQAEADSRPKKIGKIEDLFSPHPV